MLRNFLFTLLGLGIFILGGITGPPIWNTLTQSSNIAESPALVESETKPVAVKDDEKQSTEMDPALQDESLQHAEQETPGQYFTDLDDGIMEDEHTPSYEDEENIPAITTQIIEAKFEDGDTLIPLFQDYTDTNTAYALVDLIEKEFPVKNIRPGKSYLVEFDAEKDKILRFEYTISALEKLLVKADNDTFIVTREKAKIDKKLAFVEGTIDNSLYVTVVDLKETPALAAEVEKMFSWDINFIRDIKVGDSFSILVEKNYHKGEFVGYGRTIGATFTNKGKKYESFLYYDAKKKEMYYNAEGENKRRVLLQSPLKSLRVTSGYTHSRKHPIHGTYKPHLGVDYGAPMGTPIMAVGDGTITYLGWRGGYGKHITVRHESGLESMYSHLSRYGRRLKKGSKVSQGQTIGYVGSTGISTGPHLDFRLKQNGKFINPGKAINPRAAGVIKVHKQGFDKRKQLVREFMDGTRTLDSYEPSSMDVSQK